MLVASLFTNNLETYECQLHLAGLAPYSATHIHIAAMHIKKTTSNNEDDNNKLGLRSNNKHGLTSV